LVVRKVWFGNTGLDRERAADCSLKDSFVDTVKEREIQPVNERSLDHDVRLKEYYGEVNGGLFQRSQSRNVAKRKWRGWDVPNETDGICS
jgi:hypothetical protein